MNVLQIFNALAAKNLSAEQQLAFLPELMAKRGMEKRDGLWLPIGTEVSQQDIDQAEAARKIRLSANVPIEKVAEVFQALRSMENMGYAYPNDGCHARPHLMCAKIFDLGYIPQKVWAFEESYSENKLPRRLDKGVPPGALHVKYSNDHTSVWNFHIAVHIKAERPNGEILDVILDPAVFDGPVLLREWQKTIHALEENVQVRSYGVAPLAQNFFHRPMAGDYYPQHIISLATDASARKHLAQYIEWASEPLPAGVGLLPLFKLGQRGDNAIAVKTKLTP